MKKNILITGGLGFIGTNLIRRLLKTTSFTITILDKLSYPKKSHNLPSDKTTKGRVKIVDGDVLKKRVVKNLAEDAFAIVHMAANTHTFDSLTSTLPAVMTNVVGTTIMLEAALKNQVEKFILFSSSGVYGNKIKGIPMDENHPLIPVNPYGASKLAADRIAYSFFLTNKLPVVILRPFNIYGPYQSTKKMIPLFITRLIKNLPIYLNHAGKQKRDWLYVEDLVNALDLIIKAPKEKVAGEIFNVGRGETNTVAETAKLLLKKLHKNRDLIQISKSSQPEVLGNVGISKRIKQVLGWTPRHSLEEGLDKTIKWYLNNRSWWDRL